MAVLGVPSSLNGYAMWSLKVGFAMIDALESDLLHQKDGWLLRVGIHSGEVIVGGKSQGLLAVVNLSMTYGEIR